MAYQIATIPITLRIFQGHSPIAVLFKWIFYIRAAADTISTTNRVARSSATTELLVSIR